MVFVQDIIVIPDVILENAADLIGYKARARSVLQQLKLPTPPAFVVTSAAFYHFLNYQNGLNKWRSILDNAQALSPENMVAVSQQLQKLVRSHPIDPELHNNITKTYRKIIGNRWAHLTISPTPATKAPVNLPLPVVKGETALIDFLRQIWSAQLSPHSLSLQLITHQPLIQLAPVMVSCHDTALQSGTITTIEPNTNNKSAMVIEAIYGTNPQTDHQHIPGDIYVVDRTTHAVISRRYQAQTTAITADYFGRYVSKKIPTAQQYAPKLNSQQIDFLVESATKVHSHQLAPQVINWLITKSGVYFTRFHPLEVKTTKGHLESIPKPSPANSHITELAKGLVASPGICTAPLIRLSSQTSSLSGKVVLLTQPDPDLLPKLRQASGIIIESGGITSSISLAARDIGIPTLVGTGRLTVADGQVITLDAIKGRLIIDTTPPKTSPPIQAKINHQPTTAQRIATKLYLSINQINDHFTDVYQQATGVGGLYGNDIVLNMGIHPKRIVDRHLPAFKADFIHKLTEAANLFGDRPVYYHPIDIPTNLGRKLEHGSVYEPIQESNTYFGFRGAFRAAADAHVFQTELDLLAELRNKHALKNLCLCLPLVRHPAEFSKLKRMTAATGLFRSPSFKLAAKIGTPAAINFIPKLAAEGLDSLIIDLDLLGLAVQGYDPDSSEVDQELDPVNPATISLLQTLIDSADSHHLTHFVTSYHLSQSAELITAVIQAGASNLIIQAPQYYQVKSWTAHAEAKLVSTTKRK